MESQGAVVVVCIEEVLSVLQLRRTHTTTLVHPRYLSMHIHRNHPPHAGCSGMLFLRLHRAQPAALLPQYRPRRQTPRMAIKFSRRFAPSFFSLDYREVPIPSIYTQAPAGGFEISVLWGQSALDLKAALFPISHMAVWGIDRASHHH